LPTVHVYVWEGFGKDRVKTLIQGITKVFGGLGVRKTLLKSLYTRFRNPIGA
jgi:hypothetical protein